MPGKVASSTLFVVHVILVLETNLTFLQSTVFPALSWILTDVTFALKPQPSIVNVYPPDVYP
jgi:hypothetical protein